MALPGETPAAPAATAAIAAAGLSRFLRAPHGMSGAATASRARSARSRGQCSTSPGPLHPSDHHLHFRPFIFPKPSFPAIRCAGRSCGAISRRWPVSSSPSSHPSSARCRTPGTPQTVDRPVRRADRHSGRALVVREAGGVGLLLFEIGALVAISSVAYEFASVFYNAMLPSIATPARIGGLSGLSLALGNASGRF